MALRGAHLSWRLPGSSPVASAWLCLGRLPEHWPPVPLSEVSDEPPDQQDSEERTENNSLWHTCTCWFKFKQLYMKCFWRTVMLLVYFSRVFFMSRSCGCRRWTVSSSCSFFSWHLWSLDTFSFSLLSIWSSCMQHVKTIMSSTVLRCSDRGAFESPAHSSFWFTAGISYKLVWASWSENKGLHWQNIKAFVLSGRMNVMNTCSYYTYLYSNDWTCSL